MKCLTASFMCNQCTTYVQMCVYMLFIICGGSDCPFSKQDTVFNPAVCLCLRTLMCFKTGFSLHLGAWCL